MSLRPLLLIPMVLEMLGTSLCFAATPAETPAMAATACANESSWERRWLGITVLTSAPSLCGQGRMLAVLAVLPRQVCEMAVDLGLWQSIMNPAQQPERTGSAGV